MTVEIDGSYGEGGGSVLRLCAAMGIIFQKRIHVFKIRANRDNPGLREQHLMGLQALTKLCGGSLVGGSVGSTDITFMPGTIKPGTIDVKIGTAGAIGLVYQVLSIGCAGFVGTPDQKVEINIVGGGTFNKWAPSTTYIINVLMPLLERVGFRSSVEIKRHGFYPKGGAAAKITFYPVQALKGLVLDERGDINTIGGESVATVHLKNARVAERQATGFTNAIKGTFAPNQMKISMIYVDAANPGSGITTWAMTTKGCIISSGSVLGEKGIPAESVGKDCARDLQKVLFSTPMATVDEYTSDQLIPFLMLSKERSIIIAPQLTSHAKTNIDMMRMFTSRPCNITEKKDVVVMEFPAA
nr:RNA 3'-terminal phosphate cyclase [Candidatus Sigynarchaeota archaeon]